MLFALQLCWNRVSFFRFGQLTLSPILWFSVCMFLSLFFLNIYLFLFCVGGSCRPLSDVLLIWRKSNHRGEVTDAHTAPALFDLHDGWCSILILQTVVDTDQTTDYGYTGKWTPHIIMDCIIRTGITAWELYRWESLLRVREDQPLDAMSSCSSPQRSSSHSGSSVSWRTFWWLRLLSRTRTFILPCTSLSAV